MPQSYCDSFADGAGTICSQPSCWGVDTSTSRPEAESATLVVGRALTVGSKGTLSQPVGSGEVLVVSADCGGRSQRCTSCLSVIGPVEQLVGALRNGFGAPSMWLPSSPVS